MKRSKRIEALDRRAVNKDGFIDEWPEMGFVAMKSPYDPKPSIAVEGGVITELDGKKREDFDFLDQFIADYAIRQSRLWKLPEKLWTSTPPEKKYWKLFPESPLPRW